MRKVTILGFFCLALILAALPFAACAQPAPAQAPIVIQPTPAAPAVAPAAPAVTPAPATPAPATPVVPMPAAPAAPAAPAGPVFTVLDPRGNVVPIPFVGISPRLDTLEGKKIGVVNMMGGNEVALTTVAPAINEAYSGVEAVYFEMKDSRGDAEWAFIESCDAIILGNNY